MRTIYIDGATLDGAIEELEAEIGISQIPFDYFQFVNRLGHERAYYYDAYPAQKSGESSENFAIRKTQKDLKFSSLNLIPGMHVRTGTTRWGKSQRQKAVDVLLAVDAVSHALTGTTDFVTIVASDLDFYPIFEQLLHSRVQTRLVYRPKITASELIEVADTRLFLTKTLLLNSCEPSFAASHQAEGMQLQGSLTEDERNLAAISTFRGRELAIWRDDSGLWTCHYGHSRIRSLSRDLAIERFTQDANEVLKFSDESKYP